MDNLQYRVVLVNHREVEVGFHLHTHTEGTHEVELVTVDGVVSARGTLFHEQVKCALVDYLCEEWVAHAEER